MSKLYEKFLIEATKLYEENFRNAYSSLRNIIAELESRGASINKTESTFEKQYIGDDVEYDNRYEYFAEIYFYDCEDEEEIEKYLKGIYNRFKLDYDFDTYSDGSCYVSFVMGYGDEEDMYAEDIYK